MASTPYVGIVRHQQFRPSETFIASQAFALRSFRPLFIGRDTIPPAAGVHSVNVAEHGKAALLSYTLTRKSTPLRRDIADHGAVLLHAHFGVEGVYTVHTARSLDVPLITTLHGFDVTVTKSRLLMSRKPSWLNYVAWRKSLFDVGAAFICVSQHIRQRAIDWGYPADRVSVLPIGVDTELIKPVKPVETPRILHVARLVEKKGTANLLRAFAVVKNAVPAAELVVIGDGPLVGALRDLARRLDVAGSVRFMGAQSHQVTLSELADARLLCLPSVTAPNGDQEGLGMVLLEAAATGRPVVATDHGGIPEAVDDGVNGFLVPEHAIDALAERLLLLLQDAALCQQFGDAGRSLVVERFNLRSQTERLESLYRSLM